MIFGYAYPAYECFKAAENNRTDIAQVLSWCRYWILVAMLTVCERVGDHLIFWLPMYSEAKVAFFIYLWHPKTKGTEYVYDCFFRPFVAKHETEIDRNLLEMKVQAEEIALIYWQKAAAYGQTKFFEILQCVSSQSTASMPRSDQVASSNLNSVDDFFNLIVSLFWYDMTAEGLFRVDHYSSNVKPH
ncbi:hypothetical protein NC651_011421 [Populus alba x Populus x berolinensis]|nr:hypothetical protein NC651_011421 [Populus alba x Populus x berolinensis]